MVPSEILPSKGIELDSLLNAHSESMLHRARELIFHLNESLVEWSCRVASLQCLTEHSKLNNF